MNIAQPTIAGLQSQGPVALAKIRRKQQSHPQWSHSAGGCRIKAKKREWDVNEIPLRERVVAALKQREEYQRAEGMLLSDWTLAAVKQREEDRSRHEWEEKQRAKETFVGDSLITFKQKEEERREKQKEEKQRAEEPPLIDPILIMKQKEEERRKEEPAAEAAVVTMERAEIAEAKIVDEQAEAARPAKDEWRAREEAESVSRALEDGRQREHEETRAVPKSGIVRSRGGARMIRGVLSTLTTIAIASAIGFGAGVYATPPDKADEFRALVNSKLDEINGLMNRERAAIEPKAKAPSEAAAPIAPEAAPQEIQSAVPAEPAAEAPAADAAGQKDMPNNNEMPDANAAPPSASPAESSNSQSAPAPSAESAAPAMSETPSNAAEAPQAKPVANKTPVAKPHVKAPVKKATPKPKPKPKPKPAEQHPKAQPAEPAPAAEEPAQQ